MLYRLFYLLFFMVIVMGVAGFFLNSSDAGPKDFYKLVIGKQNSAAPGLSNQTVLKNQEASTRTLFAQIDEQQQKLKEQVRDLRWKIQGVRENDRARWQDSNDQLSKQKQSNDDQLRRQRDKLRDMQAMARDRLADRGL